MFLLVGTNWLLFVGSCPMSFNKKIVRLDGVLPPFKQGLGVFFVSTVILESQGVIEYGVGRF